MENYDIIISICQYLDDIEKFYFLSATTKLDIMKGKILFNDAVNLYQIYFHRYFNQFTNIIVCDKVEEITLPNGVVLRKRKPRLPRMMRRIEFQTSINYLYRDLFWEGITHIKFDDGQCIQKFYGERRKKYILPQSLTHFVAKGHKIYDMAQYLPLLKYVDGYKISFSEKYVFKHLEHITDTDFVNVLQHPNVISLKYPKTQFFHWDKNEKLCFDSSLSLEKITINYDDMRYALFNNFTSIKYLNLKNIRYTDASTLQFPPNLTHLQISAESPVSYLPSTLTHLYVYSYDDLVKVPLNLPNLTHLVISERMAFVDHHYPRLYSLKCNYFKKECIIPSTVWNLKIKNYCGKSAWRVPNTVTHLEVSRNIIYYIGNGNYYFDGSKLVPIGKALELNVIVPSSVTYLTIKGIECYLSLAILQHIEYLTLTSECFKINKETLSQFNIYANIKREYNNPFITKWNK